MQIGRQTPMEMAPMSCCRVDQEDPADRVAPFEDTSCPRAHSTRARAMRKSRKRASSRRRIAALLFSSTIRRLASPFFVVHTGACAPLLRLHGSDGVGSRTWMHFFVFVVVALSPSFIPHRYMAHAVVVWMCMSWQYFSNGSKIGVCMWK